MIQFNVIVFSAVIWQLMRAYTLSVLTQLANSGSPLVEKEIVNWVNTKLQQHNKTSSLKGFQVNEPFHWVEFLAYYIKKIGMEVLTVKDTVPDLDPPYFMFGADSNKSR